MKPFLTLLMLLLWSSLLTGCDAWSSRPDPLATVIEEIRVEPNPVVTGGTATFTVIIADSTKPGFSYYWSVPGGAETTEPRYVWIASVEPREYTFSVQLLREGAYEPVQRAFEVTVMAGGSTTTPSESRR